MEKKEIGFADKFEAAGKELEKELKDGGTMIMIASEGRNLKGSLCYIKGSPTTAAILLGDCAYQNKNFKTILEKALMYAELEEQTNK